MSSYDKEQEEIIEKVMVMKDLPREEKADKCERLIRNYLQKRLDELGVYVALKKRIKGIVDPKTKRHKTPDLLVVKVKNTTKPLCDEYELNQVLHVIEVKKNYLRPNRIEKLGGVGRYLRLKELVSKADPEKNIEFSFIRCDKEKSDSDKVENELRKVREEGEYFLLNDDNKIRKGEWGNFVKRIKTNLESRTKM